jgi:hypothetical protein
MKIRSYVSHFPGSTQELKYTRVPLSHVDHFAPATFPAMRKPINSRVDHFPPASWKPKS